MNSKLIKDVLFVAIGGVAGIFVLSRTVGFLSRLIGDSRRSTGAITIGELKRTNPELRRVS